MQAPVAASPVNMHTYKPREDEKEKASNSYLMSVVTMMVGIPLPIVNLLATGIFFFAYRKSTLFVKWHCTQALLSQLTVFFMNAVSFSWTMSIIFGDNTLSDRYIGYILTVIGFNLFEVIANIIAAVSVRKGKHISWWFWGSLTDKIMGTV